MEPLSRAGGLVTGERRVQLAVGNVGELAPAVITVATEKLSEARTARRATGNHLMASSPCLISRFGLMSDDATTLLAPVHFRFARSRRRRETEPGNCAHAQATSSPEPTNRRRSGALLPGPVGTDAVSYRAEKAI